MTNYDDVLGQIQSAGLLVKLPLEIDTTKSVRSKVDGMGREERGWYWLHRKLIQLDNKDGTPGPSVEVIVGAFGVYQGNDPGTQKVKVRLDGKVHRFNPEEAAAIRARHEADRKRVEAERAREAATAARRAGKVWAKSLQVEPPEHAADYLTRKGVANFGLRYSPTGSLVVPMADASGKIHGLQFILPSHHPRRKKTGRDKEYWPAGLSKKGRFHLIGSPSVSGLCLVAEGYATGATLHQATGLPVAVAFDAGNLLPVATEIRKQYKRARIMVCADDDYLSAGNPGVTAAQNAALAVSGEWVAPVFPSDREGKKLTDFNDLQHFPEGGLALVRSQIEAKLQATGWERKQPAGAGASEGGGGNLKPLLSVDEAVERYSLIYGAKGSMFDHQERMLVHKDDVLNITPDHCWREWKTRPDRRVVRLDEVGFDPTGRMHGIKCNLWGGWPSTPVAGKCDLLLELLRYLCSVEDSTGKLYDWILKWLAYPIQHPGAKMHSALLVHGPQGTGKSRFFEAYAEIYGEYGLVLDQGAIEDKFNADWASKRLFIVADEIVARQDMFHIKNRLKTFITGKTIRINPKSLTAYTESNHMNLVFLSNEKQPLVLENDDRRHCVLWTPPKPDQGFFDEVNEEIAAGGVAALHQHLLDLDLGDFKPWTYPPMTDAKRDLIALGVGSEERFIQEWRDGEIGKPFCPCGSADLYATYKTWAVSNGVPRIRESNQFFGFIAKLGGWQKAHKDVFDSLHYSGTPKRQRMILPSEADLGSAARLPGSRDWRKPDTATQTQWLTDCFFAFKGEGA